MVFNILLFSQNEQLVEKENKVREMESKIGELERRLQAGGISPVGGNRKSSADSTTSGKEVSTSECDSPILYIFYILRYLSNTIFSVGFLQTHPYGERL